VSTVDIAEFLIKHKNGRPTVRALQAILRSACTSERNGGKGHVIYEFSFTDKHFSLAGVKHENKQVTPGCWAKFRQLAAEQAPVPGKGPARDRVAQRHDERHALSSLTAHSQARVEKRMYILDRLWGATPKEMANAQTLRTVVEKSVRALKGQKDGIDVGVFLVWRHEIRLLRGEDVGPGPTRGLRDKVHLLLSETEKALLKAGSLLQAVGQVGGARFDGYGRLVDSVYPTPKRKKAPLPTRQEKVADQEADQEAAQEAARREEQDEWVAMAEEADARAVKAESLASRRLEMNDVLGKERDVQSALATSRADEVERLQKKVRDLDERLRGLKCTKTLAGVPTTFEELGPLVLAQMKEQGASSALFEQTGTITLRRIPAKPVIKVVFED
jgi:hypothetical protein